MELFGSILAHKLNILIVRLQKADSTLTDAIACAACGHVANTSFGRSY